MPDKEEISRMLAAAHRKLEPTISRVFRIHSSREGDPSEPLKLLEVNGATFASGILPIAFTAAPPDIPFPSVVVEVSAEEFDQVIAGTLRLPFDWSLGEELVGSAA